MPLRTRPPDRQDEILAYLRQRILSGALRPGAKLPTRGEVVRRFAASCTTVQRAFERLMEEGFVESSSRSGTFVSSRPPHLHRFGLVFPAAPGDGNWVRLWSVLAHVAPEVGRRRGCRIATYLGANAREPGRDFAALLRDVQARALAGVIFATPPDLVAGTPIVDRPGIPRVMLTAHPPKEAMDAVLLDMSAFVGRALDRLVARKRRRVAVIVVPGHLGIPLLEQEMASRGLEYRPHRIQMMTQEFAPWTSNLAQLLLHGPARERPDGLLVVDDNLVEYACQGLLAEGLRIPRDLDVIAHCNFPAPAVNVLPVARLGFDLRQTLEVCLDVLGRQRRGTASGSLTTIEPRFEWELDEGRASVVPLAAV